jgi:hypothetical protein
MGDTLPAKRGRPSVYTETQAHEICERLAAGETLLAICRSEHLPAESVVRRWVLDNREGFAAKYATAREVGYQRMADELFEIADDGSNDWMERKRQDGSSETILNAEHVNRSRLRVDTRKWFLSKVLPKIYGDRTQHEHSGTVTLEALVSGSFQKSVEHDTNAIIEHDPKDGE